MAVLWIFLGFFGAFLTAQRNHILTVLIIELSCFNWAQVTWMFKVWDIVLNQLLLILFQNIVLDFLWRIGKNVSFQMCKHFPVNHCKKCKNRHDAPNCHKRGNHVYSCWDTLICIWQSDSSYQQWAVHENESNSSFLTTISFNSKFYLQHTDYRQDIPSLF